MCHLEEQAEPTGNVASACPKQLRSAAQRDTSLADITVHRQMGRTLVDGHPAMRAPGSIQNQQHAQQQQQQQYNEPSPCKLSMEPAHRHILNSFICMSCSLSSEGCFISDLGPGLEVSEACGSCMVMSGPLTSPGAGATAGFTSAAATISPDLVEKSAVDGSGCSSGTFTARCVSSGTAGLLAGWALLSEVADGLPGNGNNAGRSQAAAGLAAPDRLPAMSSPDCMASSQLATQGGVLLWTTPGPDESNLLPQLLLRQYLG